MKYLLASLFLLVTIFQLKSQDAVFSQFHLSPLNLNPALAGSECGDQLILNYRDQWGSILKSNNLRTGSFSYDRPFVLKNGDRIGVGTKFLINQTGSILNNQTRNGTVAFSYEKNVFETKKNTHFLSGGIEIGWGQKRFKINEEDFIALNPTEFTGLKGSDDFLETGWGLNYRTSSITGKNWNFGFAVFHANEPEYQFSSTPRILDLRYAFHVTGDIVASSRLDIRPRLFYTTQSNSDLWIADLGFRYFMNEKLTHSIELSVGGKFLGGDFVDFLLISGAYFYKNIGLSIMHEINEEELNFNGINRYEAAVIYRFCK